ncbi:MAG: tRNA (adenosine(37)-N6)-dimethylallyltransferase MiaA [Chlorobiaceae bacterium]
MHSSSSLPAAVVILGPTASGKSALAAAVARKCGAEIISADSRQIYRELTIGAAKPSRETLQEIRHHFIDEKSIGEPFSAGEFASEALLRIQEIHRRGKKAIVAGGSTLYLEGIISGFSDLPPSDPEIRRKLLLELEQEGRESLFRRLVAIDPVQAATLDQTKTHRLIRSLEIITLTGQTVTALQAAESFNNAPFRTIPIGIDTARQRLYEAIDKRTDLMIENGLIEEAEGLYGKFKPLLSEKPCPPLQSVGYQELFEYFNGTVDLARAVSLIKQHTRNYAKRQMTFFRNRLEPTWIEAPEKIDEWDSVADDIAALF